MPKSMVVLCTIPIMDFILVGSDNYQYCFKCYENMMFNPKNKFPVNQGDSQSVDKSAGH
jgi:hypothetical protein